MMTPANEAITVYTKQDVTRTRNAMHVCIHCTSAVHETRRTCTFCGHEVNTPREQCLCGQCLREPRERP